MSNNGSPSTPSRNPELHARQSVSEQTARHVGQLAARNIVPAGYTVDRQPLYRGPQGEVIDATTALSNQLALEHVDAVYGGEADEFGPAGGRVLDRQDTTREEYTSYFPNRRPNTTEAPHNDLYAAETPEDPFQGSSGSYAGKTVVGQGDVHASSPPSSAPQEDYVSTSNLGYGAAAASRWTSGPDAQDGQFFAANMEPPRPPR